MICNSRQARAGLLARASYMQTAANPESHGKAEPATSRVAAPPAASSNSLEFTPDLQSCLNSGSCEKPERIPGSGIGHPEHGFTSRKTRLHALLGAAVLALFTAAVYLPVVRNGFVNYDDPQFITENSYVQQGLTPAGVRYALSDTGDGYLHPLPTLSFMLDASCAGLNPVWFHSVNLGIHVCNVMLLFLLFSRATDNLLGGALAAAFFAVHPLNVESVAWVTERKGLLNALFFLGSLVWYVSFTKTGRRRYLGASVLAFILSLLCKPMSISLPLVLLLLDFWPLRRLDLRACDGIKRFAQGAWPRILEKLPYFCVAFAFSVLTLGSETSIGNVGAVPLPSGAARLAAVASGYLEYLSAAFAPLHLVPFYPPQPLTHAGAKLLICIVGLAAVVAAFRRLPSVAVGISWFIVMLLPVSNLISHGLAARADRYMYLSAIGLFMAAAYAACSLKSLPKRGACGTLVLAVIVCAGLTRAQVPRWHDSITLFSYTSKVSPNNYIALNNLAWELLKTNAPGERIDPALMRMAEDASRLTGFTRWSTNPRVRASRRPLGRGQHSTRTGDSPAILVQSRSHSPSWSSSGTPAMIAWA